MVLSGKLIEELTKDDLQALVDNQVAESKAIEYKESLPSNSNEDKREFLADVTSFANASGGHLLFGIKESEGVPTKICGLGDINVDDSVLRLESLLRDSVEPRLPGVLIQPVPYDSNNAVLVIRVPKSWASPHRVKFKGHGHFYVRNSAGKNPMDVSELKTAFSLSETLFQRIRAFRSERLRAISSQKTPVVMREGPKTILHIVSIGQFDGLEMLDLSTLVSSSLGDSLLLLGTQPAASLTATYNFDGFVKYSHAESQVSSYVQVFRNGVIEAVDSQIIKPKRIPGGLLENRLIQGSERFMKFQQSLGAEPPFAVMISLLGVKDFELDVGNDILFSERNRRIDRNDLVMTEILIDSTNIDIAFALRPAFDSVWNAAGWPKSMNYDDDGERTRQ